MTQKASRLYRLKWPHLRQKQTTVAMRTYLQMKSFKLIMETIQPLTVRKEELNRAAQTLDG